MLEWLRYKIVDKPLVKPMSDDVNPPILIIPPLEELEQPLNLKPGSVNYFKVKPSFRMKYIKVERMKFSWRNRKEWWKDLINSYKWKKEIRSLLNH